MRGEASIVEQVRNAAVGVASSYGLDIFDVRFRREAYGMVLRVQIDRPGPAATAEESAAASEELNAQAETTMDLVRALELMVGGTASAARPSGNVRSFESPSRHAAAA